MRVRGTGATLLALALGGSAAWGVSLSAPSGTERSIAVPDSEPGLTTAAPRSEAVPRGGLAAPGDQQRPEISATVTELRAMIDDGNMGRTPRSSERIEVVEENIPQATLHRDDADVDIGQTRVIYPGFPARVERTFHVVEEYGVEVSRHLVREVVLEAGEAAVIGHGTRPLTLETPYGVVRYTRSLPVVATYYTPANGGKPPDHPWYGITATGAKATRGIIAVDPRVIPMYSWVYVPGYGIAQARDVGSAIIGNHIDVCFDDGDGAWWGTRYLTVYLLVR
jgi:3D (Asp-Asp-Asp) domain-containing protein